MKVGIEATPELLACFANPRNVRVNLAGSEFRGSAAG
jgi:hypothetical protein